MKQIKNYLSKIHDLNTVLCVGQSESMEKLKKWLTTKKNVQVLAKEASKSISVDVVIFDFGTSVELLTSAPIPCKYLIGRLQKEEDYFLLWEKYRNIAGNIYFTKDKGLPKEAITEDVGPNDILDWKISHTGVELSVVLPVYNVSKYLKECIESLTWWKAEYVEFIFVDDGSPDDSAQIIREAAKEDSRIHLIQKENGGCASARNRGIEEAKGTYIGFVDSDDFVNKTMFQKLLQRALLGNFDLTYCGYQEYYEDSGESQPVLNDCLKAPYLGGTYRVDQVQLLAVNTRVAIWRCLYKKEVLDQYYIRFHEDLKRFDDLPFRLEYIWVSKSAACVPEHLYYYRLGRKGQDVSCSDERLYVHFPIFEYLDAYIAPMKDQKLYDLLQIVKIQTHGFGLSKLEKKYKKTYLKKAKKQLDRNMGYWRTLALILMYTGKGNLFWYTKMKLFTH